MSQTILITGANRGIGLEFTRQYLEAGNHVIACCRDPQQAPALQQMIQAYPGSSIISLDVCRQASIFKLKETVGKQAIDILINNAAVFHKQSLLSASAADIRAELDINFIAPFLLIRAFASHVRKGSVINLLDSRITSNEPGALTYVLSKKALAGLTKMAAMELAPSVRVNGVAPGPVLTPSAHGNTRDKAGFIPLQRKPAVKDLVTAVIFLLECDSITGQILFVDGGQHLLGSEA